jgi:DNA-binding NtrC family response regulator
VKQGQFREDLFYRLNVLPIELPPLRNRKNDIDSLAAYFIEKFNQQHRKQITGIAPDVLALLKAHQWPGNIRELENVIEHSFVIESQTVLTIASLPEVITRKRGAPVPSLSDVDDLDEEPLEDLDELAGPVGLSVQADEKGFTLNINRLDFEANKEEFERQFLISALKVFKGRINQTALHANIPKKTLLRKLQKYGITAKDYA